MWTKRWQRREATSDLRVGGIGRWLGAIALLAWVLSGATARAASEPKYGGILNATQSDPPTQPQHPRGGHGRDGLAHDAVLQQSRAL